MSHTHKISKKGRSINWKECVSSTTSVRSNYVKWSVNFLSMSKSILFAIYLRVRVHNPIDWNTPDTWHFYDKLTQRDVKEERKSEKKRQRMCVQRKQRGEIVRKSHKSKRANEKKGKRRKRQIDGWQNIRHIQYKLLNLQTNKKKRSSTEGSVNVTGFLWFTAFHTP